MSDNNKSLVAINTLLDTLLFEEGRLTIVNKNSSLLNDDRLGELSTKQRDNLDKAFEIYKNLKPIMTEIASVSLEMKTFVEKALGVEIVSQENNNLDSTNNVSIVNYQEPVMISNDDNEVVVPTVSENAISNDGNLIESDSNVAENNTIEINPVVDENEGFVLSPIDDGVAPVQTSEEQSSTDLAATEQQLQAIENVKQEIINTPGLNEEEKKEALEKYTRVTENAVKAILVTKVQLEKLTASRIQQKSLINNDGVQNIIMPSVQNVQQEQTNVSVPNANDLQTMIETANALYKEGKTQEAQVLFNQVGEMNKQLQAQVTGTGDQVLVKK